MFGRKNRAATCDDAPTREEITRRLAARADTEESRESWRQLLRHEGTAEALADLDVLEQVWDRS